MRKRIRAFVGDRQATTPLEVASWIVALLLLTLVLRTNQVLADSPFFFLAHDMSPRSLVLIWIGAVGLLLVMLTGLAFLARRLTSARVFDLIATVATLVAGLFLLGNAFGWALGVLTGVGFTVLSRRVAFGKPLLVIAAVTSVIPLALVPPSTQNEYSARIVRYQDRADRPNVLWIIADAAQSQVLFTPNGEVRPLFPNLRRLQETSTTYSRGYSTANHTPLSVASMLNGLARIPLGDRDIKEMEGSPGIVSWLAPAYDVTVDSEVFRSLCTSERCSQSRSAGNTKIEDLGVLIADVTAVAGNTMQPALAAAFPPLEGRWRDFWATQSSDGGQAASSIQDWLTRLGTHDRPQFALWHSLETHDPYDRDFEGRHIFDERELMASGAWFDLNGSYPSVVAERLARRLYLAGAVAFDRQLGVAMDQLQASDEFGGLMLIVSADHGVAFSRGSHIRVGEDATMRWNEVAHVPLMVKYPGQTEPRLVSEPRSTAQIVGTVLDAGGVVVEDGPALAPRLELPPDEGPFFVSDMGLDTPMIEELPGDLVISDTWTQRDLEAPTQEFPFAATDPDIAPGAPLKGAWTEFTPSRIELTQRTSPLQLLALEDDSAQCPVEDSRAVVTLSGKAVAEVVWEQTGRANPDLARGWAVVPRAQKGDYAFWCQPV